MPISGFRRTAWRRCWRWPLALATVAVAAIAWRDTTAEPVMLSTTVVLPGLPVSAGPLRVAFVSDLHVIGPTVPPAAIAALVARINTQHPDIVLLGGDYLGNYWTRTRTYSMREAVAPLAGLHPRLGTVAVLGNHDHPDVPPPATMPASLDEPPTEAQRELERIGVHVLINQALRLGPVTIAGRDIEGAGFWAASRLDKQLGALGPPWLGLAHKPRAVLALPDAVRVVLAGHSHCGQVRLPVITAIMLSRWQPARYACGRTDEDGRTLIVTGGIGESRIPVRFRAPPEFWMVTLVPPAPGSPPPAARPRDSAIYRHP